VVVLLAASGVWAATRDTPTTTSSTTTIPSRVSDPSPSVLEDGQFLAEVSEVDPTLASYEKTSGNLALASLLNAGTAFCGFLGRDRDLDTAMVSVAVGAQHQETASHLPLSVTTFNTIDSLALLSLCPSLQSMVPSSVRARIHQLGSSIGVG
jgi:hypothetical protein